MDSDSFGGKMCIFQAIVFIVIFKFHIVLELRNCTVILRGETS